MAPGIDSYLTVFAVAAGVTLAITPVMRRISERWGLMVEPDARRVHEKSTAVLGGVAMFVGFLSAMGVAWLLSDFDVVFATASEPVGIVIAALVMIVFGTYDDVREMSAPAKVASMVLAGSILSFAGVTVLNLRLPVLDAVILSPDLAFVVTVLWLVAIVNAINLIDGWTAWPQALWASLDLRSSCTPSSSPMKRCCCPTTSGRWWPSSPAVWRLAFCPRTSIGPVSSWATAARFFWAHCWPLPRCRWGAQQRAVCRADLLLVCAHAHSADHLGGAGG